MYVVVIITDTHLYRMQAENDKKYTIGTGKKDVMEIPELGESSLGLIFHANPQRLEVKGKKIRLTAMTLSEPSNLQQICDSPRLSIRWSEDGGEYKESCPIPYDCQIYIGRGLSNDIVLRENYISRKHLVVTSDKGQIRVEDLGSTNGIYLNGSPVTKAMLKSGDVIDILELRIRCENSRLFFENLHSVPEIKDHAEGAGTGVVFTPEGTGYLSYHRSPRIRESLPDRPVTLSRVPNKPRIFSGRRGGLIQVISSGAIAGASIAMGAFSPAMLAMRAAMMVSPVAGMIAGSGKKAQKMLRVEEEERFRKYSEYISGEKAHIEAIGERQSEIINRENPAPDLCRQILEELRTALWERKSSDSDFLQVRMGAGYAPLCVEVKPPIIDADELPGADKLNEAQNRRVRGEKLPPPKYGSRSLKKVVLKACEYRPENRYAAADLMRAALEEAEKDFIADMESDGADFPGNGTNHTDGAVTDSTNDTSQDNDTSSFHDRLPENENDGDVTIGAYHPEPSKPKDPPDGGGGDTVWHQGSGGIYLEGEYPPEKYIKAIRIWMIVGCVLLGCCTIGIGLAWTIPITVNIFKKIKTHEPISFNMKIVTLLFVSPIAGIMMIMRNDM